MTIASIGLVNDKGGTGKTNLAHSLAHGASMYGGEGVYVLTDNRQVLDADNRSYGIIHGSSTAVIADFVGKARAAEGNGLLVIDGAGGNPDADAWYAQICDLVLIPMTPDEEAMNCALIYAQKFPNAFVLPNRWSTNPNAVRIDNDYLKLVEDVIGADRVFPPLPSVHSVAEFVRADFTGEILPAARSFSRLLTGAVIRKLQEKGVWK